MNTSGSYMTAFVLKGHLSLYSWKCVKRLKSVDLLFVLSFERLPGGKIQEERLLENNLNKWILRGGEKGI